MKNYLSFKVCCWALRTQEICPQMTLGLWTFSENVLGHKKDMPWICPMASNVSSNFQEDRLGHRQLSAYLLLYKKDKYGGSVTFSKWAGFDIGGSIRFSMLVGIDVERHVPLMQLLTGFENNIFHGCVNVWCHPMLELM